ncbi:MAG: baseplate J/gp47 family protein [Treponema sp.]|nr:baseplate J/gp47 family protein [Treponema sp.]
MAIPYDNKNIKEIRTLIINGLQQEFNNKLRILPRSFIKVLAAVFAGVFIILYKQIGWLFLQIFPETAYWNEINILGMKIRPLVKWGILIGAGEPRRGTQWQGQIKVDVTQINSFLYSGTQLKSGITGKIYLVDNTKTLENETETIAVVCAEAGTTGNLEVGETLNFVNPLGNVKKTALVETVVKAASEDEPESEYRFRVVNRWRMQPQGGALADYRIWGMEVPGVLNIYPCKDVNSPSGVLVFVSGLPSNYPDRIPDGALLIEVGKACTYSPETGKATRKPLTAIIDPSGDETYSNVKPVSVVIFDVYVEGLTGISALDFSLLVKAPVEEYFLGREPYNRGLSDDNNRTDKVTKNNVSSVVDQVAITRKAEFDSIVMRKSGDVIHTYTLGMGELCKLGNLFINGVLF